MDHLKLFPRLIACALSEMNLAVNNEGDRFVCAYHVRRVYDLLKAVERLTDHSDIINYDDDDIGPFTEGTITVYDPDEDDYNAIMSSGKDDEDEVEDEDEVDSAIPKSRSNAT